MAWMDRASHSTTSSSSFDEALRAHLQSRLRLLLVSGFVISAIMCTVDYLAGDTGPARAAFDWDWLPFLYHGHLISFGVASLVVYLVTFTSKSLQRVGFFTMGFNLLLAIITHVLSIPGLAPFFPVALMLFLYAAFVPCRPRFQIGLALIPTVSFPLLHVLGFRYSSGVHQRLMEMSTFFKVGFNEAIGAGTVALAVLGATSVLVNKTLYNLQRGLHKAKRLGNYILERELGSGGMGKVFLGRHALIQRPTAIKILNPKDPIDRQESFGRFEREVRLVSMLTHPNTISVFDFGRADDGTFFFAMEYLEGMDLQKLVEKFGPMDSARAAFLLSQICGSLSEAHTQGVIHRDIKPSNIFVTHRGGLHDFVKVLDFGLAKRVQIDDSAGLTKTGMIFGTPRYMSPESVQGSGTVDGRADIYSLGLVAYWLLTGRPVFPSSSGIELLADHIKTRPKNPSEVSELEIHPELERIVMKCLEKSPGDRYQTAQALAADLQGIRFAKSWTHDRASDWWELHMASDPKLPGEPCPPGELCPERSQAA